MTLSRRGRAAFRLNDLVAILVVVVLTVGVLAPAAEKPKEEEARVACSNNLKQLGLAVHNYAGAYQNAIPALTCDERRAKYGAYNGNLYFTLLPFLEHADLFETGMKNARCTWYAATAPATDLPFKTSPPDKSAEPLSAHPIKVFQCPGDATVVKGLSANQTATNTTTAPYFFPWAASSYAVNYQVFGVVNRLKETTWGNACGPAFNIGNIPDGTSNTIFFGEQFAACGGSAGSLWAYPGIGNYGRTEYTTEAGTAAPNGASGLINTPEKTTGRLWCPAFANNQETYGFTAGGKAGSIYEYNLEHPEKHLTAPYDAGKFWDVPPQIDIRQADCDKSRLQGHHPEVAAVGMGDGSVHFVNSKVTQPTWYAAICPADGTPLGTDW
jgi:hypothetical protein